MKNKISLEGWREEFETKFTALYNRRQINCIHLTGNDCSEEIKSFITELIQEAREEERQRIFTFIQRWKQGELTHDQQLVADSIAALIISPEKEEDIEGL